MLCARVFFVAAASGVAALLTSCDRSLDTRLLGHWQIPNTSTEFRFQPDHTFSMAWGPSTARGTWWTETGRLVTRNHMQGLQEDTTTYEIQLSRYALTILKRTTVAKIDGRVIATSVMDLGTGMTYKRVP
jgi:hypothetical protein